MIKQFPVTLQRVNFLCLIIHMQHFKFHMDRVREVIYVWSMAAMNFIMTVD